MREAALSLFAERGYRATGMRDVAEALGVRAPSLYNHVGSKQEILRGVMIETMDRLLADQKAAVDSGEDAAERLRLAAEAHARYVVGHRREILVGNRETLVLEEPARSSVLAKREEYERGLRSVVEQASASGTLSSGEVRLASYAIIDMCNGIAVWYREDGPLEESEVVRSYGELALRTASVGPS